MERECVEQTILQDPRLAMISLLTAKEGDTGDFVIWKDIFLLTNYGSVSGSLLCKYPVSCSA